MFLKELSFRSADIRHAAKVVQEIKALRSAVQQREKEKAERATLVQQEKLVRGKVRDLRCRTCGPHRSCLCSNGPMGLGPPPRSRHRRRAAAHSISNRLECGCHASYRLFPASCPAGPRICSA